MESKSSQLLHPPGSIIKAAVELLCLPVILRTNLHQQVKLTAVPHCP